VSYTVLAVKWRPKRFAEMIGQQHVVQALVNSLAQERLHHAYLFSGTRGVGKTTVARILAKALNCDRGVVPEPCGECAACRAIDEGRFVDLIEVDAASRTRVDDTRELLDNVQYAPTGGRYKVYLIDEVHMLSNHSFNALLKTLEEPPPHVKFLLATTDPQKLPVTVLSRCLQFHLKKLTSAQITEQLTTICAAESVPAEEAALKAIARAADGSMRDALSLLDQSIAFGGGKIEAAAVHGLLGTIDRERVLALLTALAENDAAALIAESARLDELAADFGAVLDELMHALQQIAVVQLVEGKRIDESLEPFEAYADKMRREDVQLYYQIALNGRRDLAVCRDPRVGLEMTLLRMLAFRPEEATVGAAPGGARRPSAHVRSAPQAEPSAQSRPAPKAKTAAPPAAERSEPALTDTTAAPRESLRVVASNVARLERGSIDDWAGLLTAAELRGVARQLADHCEIERSTSSRLELVLAKDKSHLLTEQVRKRLESELAAHLDRELTLTVRLGEPPRKTPAQLRVESENQRMRAARESVEQDANVQAIQAAFDAVVEADSIRPVED
jgi:DNA polymerase III subunit gamma/tau